MCASKKYAHVGMLNKIKVPAKFCKEIGQSYNIRLRNLQYKIVSNLSQT